LSAVVNIDAMYQMIINNNNITWSTNQKLLAHQPRRYEVLAKNTIVGYFVNWKREVNCWSIRPAGRLLAFIAVTYNKSVACLQINMHADFTECRDPW